MRWYRFALGLTAAAALLATAGCTGDEPTAAIAAPATGGVSGPLCQALPTGDEPGNPTAIAKEKAGGALTWIPVLTQFEAAMRASGLLPELEAKPGITLLAPSDDAFEAKFSQTDLDTMFVSDKEKLRTMLKAHIVDHPLSLAELRDAGSITTLDGATVPVAKADAMAKIGAEAQTVCADYRFANGRIHIVNHVLGTLPTTGGQEDRHVG